MKCGAGSESFRHVPTRVLLVRGRARAIDNAVVTDAFRAFGPLDRVFVPPLPKSLLHADHERDAEDEGVPCSWGRLWLGFIVYPTIDIAQHALVQCNAWNSATASSALSSRSSAEYAELFLAGVGCVELLQPASSASSSTGGGRSGAGRAFLCEVTFARPDAIEAITAYLSSVRELPAPVSTSAADSASSVPPRRPVSLAIDVPHRDGGFNIAPPALPPATGTVLPRLPLPAEQFQASHYMLDPRSGLLYEASRAFYYDPGTKLYLDTASWSYLVRDITSADGFSAWTPPPPSAPHPATLASTPAVAVPAVATLSVVVQPVPAVASGDVSQAVSGSAECIVSAGASRTVPLSAPARRAAIPSAPAVLKPVAVHVPVLSAPLEVVAAGLPEDAAPSASSVPNISTSVGVAVAFACELCRRGFASAAQLQKHVEKSELHKQNLLLLETSKQGRP